MSRNIKHVGQIVNTQKRVVVVFRELPDDQTSCLVVDTDALPDWMHDDIISAVESPSAQAATNFYEFAQRSVFTDGTNMLQTLHNSRRLQKLPTSAIKMTPNNSVSVALDELNKLIAENNGGAPVVVPDGTQLQPAAMDPSIASRSTTSEPLDDAALAKSMISQADGLATEVERLRAEAYDMDPSLKPKRGRPSKATATEVSE